MTSKAYISEATTAQERRRKRILAGLCADCGDPVAPRTVHEFDDTGKTIDFLVCEADFKRRLQELEADICFSDLELPKQFPIGNEGE